MVRLFSVYHPSRTLLLLCSEVCLILISCLAALWLHRGIDSRSILSSPAGIAQLLVMSSVCVLCLYYFDLYDFRSVGGRRRWLRRLLQGLGTASLILAVVYYLFPELVVARGIYTTASVLSIALLFAARSAFAWVNQLPTQTNRTILIGLSDLGRDLTREIRCRPELGIDLIGYVNDTAQPSTPLMPLERLGSMEQLEQLVLGSRINSAIVALSDRRGRLPVDALVRLRVRGLRVLEAGTLYERITGKIPVESLLPSWVIFSDGFKVQSRMMALQRILSLLFALAGLVLAFPVMALVAVVVKLTSKGSLLYHQQRVGRNGAIFTLFKFRSMREGAESQSGAVWALDEDPRVTPVGRVLRTLHLDELPQLWNIVRGDMNFVGPRPERPEFVHMLEQEITYYSHRLIVRPGLTGWAQVRCGYGSTVEEQREKLCFDFFYIKNISFLLDLYILIQTARIILWRRGAK